MFNKERIILNEHLKSYGENKDTMTEVFQEKGIADIILEYKLGLQIEESYDYIIEKFNGNWFEISGQLDLPESFLKRYIHKINFSRYFKYNIYTDKLKFISDYLIEKRITHFIIENTMRDYPNIKIKKMVINSI